MGLLQGLTEYLPVSSSGHLAIAAELFGVDGEQNLTFTIAVHVATVLSTLVILWKEIVWIFKGLFKWDGSLNNEQRYALAILVSMIPVGIVGVFFKDYVEASFGAGRLVVGCCLLVTAALLIFSYYAKPRSKAHVSLGDAFVIGLAQAVAVLPGVSRSGSTIATGLLLGNRKESLAQFSFLMVIPPILGEALLDIVKAAHQGTHACSEHLVNGNAVTLKGLYYGNVRDALGTAAGQDQGHGRPVRRDRTALLYHVIRYHEVVLHPDIHTLVRKDGEENQKHKHYGDSYSFHNGIIYRTGVFDKA